MDEHASSSDLSPQLREWRRSPWYAALILNAAFFVYLMLSQDPVWDPTAPHRGEWLREFLLLLALVLSVLVYSLLTAMRRNWLHGLSLYGALTAVLSGGAWLQSPIHFILPVLALLSVEVLLASFLRAAPEASGHAHFARAHYVLLPAALLSATFFAASSTVQPARYWFVWSLLALYTLDLLNALLARVFRRRRAFGFYLLASGETAFFILLTMIQAALASLG